jgi:hypothetical protein
MKTAEEHAMGTIDHGSRRRWIALLPALLLLPACEEAVPQHLWDAVKANCAHRQTCDPKRFTAHYASVDDCADLLTSNIDWSEKGSACVDAEAAWNTCIAQQACNSTVDHCKKERDVSAYHCRSLDTKQYGSVCLKQDGIECEKECQGRGLFEALTCSSETPDFCNCGGLQCKHGELCCYCPPDTL